MFFMDTLRDKSEGNYSEQHNDEAEQSKLPTASNAATNPEQTSYNTEDMKDMDFNSADEIRQTMKAIISGNTPQQDFDDNRDTGKNSTDIQSPGKLAKKRPGRPPKAGTSKKVKKATVSALYLGKLSNVVRFKQKRRYRSKSGSEE